MSERNLMGRKALVTGGARGIGAAIAAALARAGADVMIGDILDDVGQATAAALVQYGTQVGFVHLDVADDGQWQHAVARTVQRLGGFDLLVNNAGLDVTALITDIEADGLRRMCEVNIIGTALGMKHAFQAMRPGGSAGHGGSVVNIASAAANIVFPSVAGYAGTKSAVERMTRVAAMEAARFGHGVRVNCIHPGVIATELGTQLAKDMVARGMAADLQATQVSMVERIPLGRMGEADNVADAVVFLSSTQARYITGVGLPVDGGMGM